MPVLHIDTRWKFTEMIAFRQAEATRLVLSLRVHTDVMKIQALRQALQALIEEFQESRFSERQGRLIDKDEAGSMEKKKREGYF